MDDNARLQLQRMIKTNNVEDQTPLIRQLKHSVVLKKEIKTLLKLMEDNTKQKDEKDDEDFHILAMTECAFLFTYYTDIFNKIRKQEIDLAILFKFLDVLENIENGQVDQHEGSFLVGTYLKEMYIDSALRKADKLNANEEEGEKSQPQVKSAMALSWKEFREIQTKKNNPKK